MLSVSKIFQAFPGYGFGINQPMMIGEISFVAADINQEELMNSIENLIGLEPLKLIPKEKIDLIDFFCKAFIFFQQSARIPISDNFFTAEISHINSSKFKVVLPIFNLLANQITINFLVNFINFYSGKAANKSSNDQITKQLQSLKDKLKMMSPKGQNYFFLINAALKLNFPILSSKYRFLKFGLGDCKIAMDSTITEKTSLLGAQIAQDKFKASKLLIQNGLPGSINFRVKGQEDAVLIAKKIQYPVVIKPADLDQGRGVYNNINNEILLRKYFIKTSELSKNILIEKHYDGDGHRLTFFNGKVVKVTKKLPLGILGDGKKKVDALILEKNEEASKKIGGLYESRIKLDEEATELLHQFNLKLDSIPDKGKFIPLKRKNNSTAGGSTEVIPLDDVHPDNIDLCIRAAELFYLDIAGIDLIIPSIKKSWLSQECAICEINSKPQTDSDTIEKILEELLLGIEKIQFHLILTNGTPTKRNEAYIKLLISQLECNGYSSKDGVFLDGKRISRPFNSGFDSALVLIQQKKLTSGLCIMSLDEIKKFGLPLNKFTSIKFIRHEEEPPLSENEISNLTSLITPHTQELNLDYILKG